MLAALSTAVLLLWRHLHVELGHVQRLVDGFRDGLDFRAEFVLDAMKGESTTQQRQTL